MFDPLVPYNDLPLTLNALDVAEVLGISRAAAPRPFLMPASWLTH
mgnify:CR=1 FL=1